MKTPKGPFWIFCDIDGNGDKWRIAFIRHDGEYPMIVYPMDDFEDFWYDDDWTPEEIKLIRTPKSV